MGIFRLFLILCFALCLTSCKTNITVIKPIKPDCVNSIKTNGDMAECLIKYMEVLNEGDLSGSR